LGRRQICVDCRKLSPETNSDHTLISAEFGWRVLRRDKAGDGAGTIEWRCPPCWQVYKRARAAESGEELPESLRGSRASLTDEARGSRASFPDEARGSRASFSDEAAKSSRGSISERPASTPPSGHPPPSSRRFR